MSFVFQHIDTVNLFTSNDVFLFGRMLTGESVCVQLRNIRPHFCVLLDVTIDVRTWFQVLKQNVWHYELSKRVLNSDGKKTVPNISVQVENISNDYMSYEEIAGQDIKNYCEEGPQRFIKIYCKDKWVARNCKHFLSSDEPVQVVFKQYYGCQSVPKKVMGKQNLPLTYTRKINELEFQEISLNYEVVECKRPTLYTIYNDQVDFPLQYLIDKDIYSCSFIEVKGREVDDESKQSTCDIELADVMSIQQVHIDDQATFKIFSYDIESVPRKIEGREDKFTFPSPWKDSVCTIGGVLQVGEELKQYAWILNGPAHCPDRSTTEALKPLTDKPDDYAPEETTVYSFDKELKMLEHFFNFIVTVDVDFIEGHNINRFDNDYMLNRYAKLINASNSLGLSDDILQTAKPASVQPVIGRLKKCHSVIRKQVFSSNQKGSHEKFKLLLPGRIILDSYDIMKDQHNETSYKLDDLAAKYLGTKKIDQDYNKIPAMFQTQTGRHDLAVYCVKDSWLVRKMMNKLCKLTVLLQMSNVTGISMKDVIERGQGIRTIALMLRYCKKRNPQYFVPRVKVNKKRVTQNVIDPGKRKLCQVDVEVESETYAGAAVIDPIIGFYKDAVSCLDFASLYPSIMRALNMSYETMVVDDTVRKMEWKQLIDKSDEAGVRTIPDYEYTGGKLKWSINTSNPTFVTHKVRKGLLPEMLEAVLFERKKVKKMMKALKDKGSTMYKVYDGRQLGLKVVANSIYGFTGATVGFLPEKKIASSVTKYGKFMLYQTKDAVENDTVWGKAGCKVIYGDTDSVFVHIPRSLVDGKDEKELMENAHAFGESMSQKITNIFLYPNDLEYEKSYSSFLLLKKKRYAGFKFEPGHAPKLQIKGLEAARRDYAPLLVETQKKMLNILLLDRNVQMACDYVGKVVFDLMNGNTPIEKLIMSKKLSRSPEKYKSVAAHVFLALRLQKEAPAIAPVSGDRVDYVIYASGNSKVSESACLPSEILSGKFSIDTAYYLEKQLKGPLMRILEKIVKNPLDLFSCNSAFKGNHSSGPLSMFAKKRSTSVENQNVYQSKRMRLLKTETRKDTIQRLFGIK